MQMGWVALGLVLACGGNRDSQTLAIEPGSPTVMVGEVLHLTAQPQTRLAGEVEWEVEENYGGGLLHSQGLTITYVPPEAAGTYHLVAHVTEANGRQQKQVVDVVVVANPTVEPSTPRVQAGGSIPFRARMRGLSRDGITWAVEESEGGEISQDGRYTAPTRPGVYHVTATSKADTTVSVRATITVD